MKIQRRLFAKSEEDKEAKKEEKRDPDYEANRAIVSGSTMALLGAASVAGRRYLLNKGIPKTKKVTKLGNAGKYILIPAGLATAGLGIYKKHKDKKERKKNEDKA